MKNKLYDFMGITGLVIIIYCLGWFASVGLFWLIQLLVNALFNLSFNFNIWLGGLLLFIIWLIIGK